MIITQPSASRTTNPRAPIPSSKLLGYYHSSALRTDNSTFRAKPHYPLSRLCLISSEDSRTASETASQETTEAEGKGGQNSEAMTVSPLLLFRALDW